MGVSTPRDRSLLYLLGLFRFAFKIRRIEGDWRRLRRILTCRGFDPHKKKRDLT
jgi:hypothetical protein